MAQIDCPKFPSDLRIGREITDLHLDFAFWGFFSKRWSTLDGILPAGEALVPPNNLDQLRDGSTH